LAIFVGGYVTGKIWDEKDIVQHTVERINTNFPSLLRVATERGHGMPSGWYYVGNAQCKFPFVIAVDSSAMEGHLAGQGDRNYFLWLFGFKVHVYSQVRWVS